MNIKDATSTLLVSAALTGLFAGPVRAEDTTTATTATKETVKKTTHKAGHKTKKECADKGSCKGKTSCKGKSGCSASKEETK